MDEAERKEIARRGGHSRSSQRSEAVPSEPVDRAADAETEAEESEPRPPALESWGDARDQ